MLYEFFFLLSFGKREEKKRREKIKALSVHSLFSSRRRKIELSTTTKTEGEIKDEEEKKKKKHACNNAVGFEWLLRDVLPRDTLDNNRREHQRPAGHVYCYDF